MKQNIFVQLKFVLSCATLVSLWGCGGGGNINTNSLQLVFMTQPSSNSTPTGTNSVVAPAIQVKVLDSKGNLDNSAAIPITLTIGNQPNADLPNGKIYTGYLNGTTTVTSVNGVASFNDISVSQPGVGYTLAANASGVSSATSNPFNVTSSITAAESAGYKSTEAKSGYEVAYTGDIGSNFQGFVYVYIDYGSNPIASDEEFRAFNCGESWVQNTPRNAVFDYANTLGSPNAAAGPLLPYTDCQGHTWGLIVQNISYIWPFESSAYPAPQPVNGWQAGQTGQHDEMRASWSGSRMVDEKDQSKTARITEVAWNTAQAILPTWRSRLPILSWVTTDVMLRPLGRVIVTSELTGPSWMAVTSPHR